MWESSQLLPAGPRYNLIAARRIPVTTDAFDKKCVRPHSPEGIYIQYVQHIYLHPESPNMSSSQVIKETLQKGVVRLRNPSVAQPSNGYRPWGQHDAAGAVLLLLRDLLLQRDGTGEHRGSCDAGRLAAADARAPEQERDERCEEREASEEAAGDRRDLLRGRAAAVRVRRRQLRRGEPWHGRLRRRGRRGRREGPRSARADFGPIWGWVG